MSSAGLMSKSKYSHNIIRTGDIIGESPFTSLESETGTIITLPLPLNLSSNMGIDWQQESVNIAKFQLIHNKEAVNNITSMSYKDMYGSLGNGIDALSKGFNVMKEDVAHIRARTKSSSKIGGFKIAQNPRNEMMFHGMQFKSYSFNFMLVPYNQKDSENIQTAIREIQKASSPDLMGAKMFMTYPETWFIKFWSGKKEGNDYLMKINECCCTGISVNYTPNGDTTNMHEDNAPLSVELTLDFTEIFIPSKENIEEFNG